MLLRWQMFLIKFMKFKKICGKIRFSLSIYPLSLFNLVWVSMVFSANQNFNVQQKMNRDDQFRMQQAAVT